MALLEEHLQLGSISKVSLYHQASMFDRCIHRIVWFPCLVDWKPGIRSKSSGGPVLR